MKNHDMNQYKRIWVFLLVLAGVLILGILFWPFVYEELLLPIGLTAWLFLRIFVLSIDQKIYWIALNLIAIFFLFRQLIQSSLFVEAEAQPEDNKDLKDIEFWRSYFTLYTHDKKEQFMVKRELTRLLVSTYASKQGVTANFLVTEALKKGDIPLPESIYSFLFDEDLERIYHPSFKQILKSLWLAPRNWMDERSGRNAAEFYRNVAEVLNFLETSLEMKNDDERSKLNSN
jgi:hypothetical protein